MLSKTAVEVFLNRKDDNWDWIKPIPYEDLLTTLKEVYPEYKHKTYKPFKHQIASLLLGIAGIDFLYFLDMGGGKSRISLDLIQYYLNRKKITRCLILTPNVISIQGWLDQIETHSFLKAEGLFGSSVERWEILNNTDAPICIVNYDGFQAMTTSLQKVVKGKKKVNKLVTDIKAMSEFASKFDMVIFDEIHNCKNSESLTFKICNVLSEKCKYKYGLTGTPFGRSPMDLWAQFYLVDRGLTLGNTLSLFREAFFDAKVEYWGRGGGYQRQSINYVFKKNLLDTLHKKIRNKSICYSEAELNDLPPLIRTQIKTFMNKELSTYYKDVIQGVINSTKSDHVEIKNAYIRLRQITSGFLDFKTDDGEPVSIVFDKNPKLDALVDLISNIPLTAKIIIFNEFIKSGDIICAKLTELGIKHQRLYSGSKNKADLIASFKEKDCRVFVINSQSGNSALNLQEASYVIYYESPVSPIIRHQSEKRAHRTGQTKTVYLYDIVMMNSVDLKIQQYLKEGKDLSESLLGANKSQFKKLFT